MAEYEVTKVAAEPTQETTTTPPTQPQDGAPPAPPPPPPPPPPPATPAPANPEEQRRWELFARRERTVVQRELALKAQEAKQAEEAKRYQEHTAAIERMRTDPVKALMEVTGLSFEDIVQRYVMQEAAPGQPKPTPPDPTIARLQKKIDELEARSTERETREKEAREAAGREQEQRIIADHLAEQWQEAEKTPEDYEMVLGEPERAREVYLTLLRQAFEEANGRPLRAEHFKALRDQTEKVLTEQEEQRILKLSKSKRFASRFAPASPPAQASQSPTPVAKGVSTPLPPPATSGQRQTDTPARKAPSEIAQSVFDEALERVGQKYPRQQSQT